MKKLLLFVFGIITAFALNAQEPEEDVELILNGFLLYENSFLYSNLSSIQQIGNKNDITSIQNQQGVLSNSVNVEQQGSLNDGYIEQSGSGHFTRLQQDGTGNEANLWSVGSLSFTLVKQDGVENFINSYINNQGWFPKAVLLQQTGNNNKIEIALLGNGLWQDSWPKAADIKQTGNDLEVTAIFDSFQNPIYIEQQEGPGGGMKVDVSTSDFAFPMKK